MPAMLKGWVDRVFTPGIIYGSGARGLAGRRVLISAKASARTDREEGVRSVSGQLSHVFHNMLALSGPEVLEPYFVFGPCSMTVAEPEECLRRYQQRLRSVAGVSITS